MKEYLSVAELSGYLGTSKSFCYKLSHTNTLPKYCPNGKLIYFKRSEVDAWIEKHRIPSQTEIEAEVDLQLYKGRRAK
jgi:prophage regulatory protein